MHTCPCAGERKYRKLFEESSDAILTVAGGGICDANQAAVVLFGYDNTELTRMAINDLVIDPSDAAPKLRRRDGTALDARITVVKADADDGDDVFIIRDVTATLALERQVQQAQKMEVVGRLAGGIAHDFNNLLTAIVGYTELLITNLSPEDPNIQDAYEIRRAAFSAARLTRHILALARHQQTRIEIIDINGIVSRTAGILRRTLGEDIGVILQLDPALKSVEADLTHLEQVVLNLAVNARDAMLRGGQLRLTTSMHVAAADNPEMMPAGEYVRLTVADTGCGIPAEFQSKVFDPFFTTKGKSGTGLGLATVYGIVKERGGHIRLDSIEGRGTTFTIDLPSTSETAVIGEPTAAPPRFLEGYATILVVEDDPRVRELTEVVLRRAGHEVVTASGPQEALAAIRDHANINLVLTDVVMPEMNGYELAEQLQRIVPGLRCVFMSGFGGNEIGIDKVSRFVAKPFTVESLTATIQHAIAVT